MTRTKGREGNLGHHTNRYNAEVYKKRYQTFLIVLFAISHFSIERKMISLIAKTKLFSEKQFYD